MRKFFKPITEKSFVKNLIIADQKLSDSIAHQATRSKILNWFWYILRIVTNVLGLPIFIFILYYKIHDIILLISILIFWLTAGIIIEFLVKRLFARIRPPVHTKPLHIGPLTIKRPHGYSFPSGHGFNTGVIIGLTIKYSLPFSIPIILMALLVAFSRIVLKFHYTTDVLIGLTIGFFYGILL